MITTISLNPSIDHTVYVDHFVEGGLNRVSGTHSVPAGKGINVALTASALGVDAECIGFMYRDGSKEFEKRLMINSTAYNFVWCEGRVRTNVKVIDRSTGSMTEINESGEPVTEAALKSMADLVTLHAENTDYLVLAGSLPPGCPVDYYRTLIQNVEGLGCRCILDADGERMRLGLEATPFMIKPNLFELEMMADRKLSSLQEIRQAAKSCVEKGIELVAVSLGEKGAILMNDDECYYAHGLKVDVKSTVGAGDAMVAGLACGCMGEYDLEETLRMGMACGTARTMTEANRVIEKATYEMLKGGIEIERL